MEYFLVPCVPEQNIRVSVSLVHIPIDSCAEVDILVVLEAKSRGTVPRDTMVEIQCHCRIGAQQLLLFQVLHDSQHELFVNFVNEDVVVSTEPLPSTVPNVRLVGALEAFGEIPL